LYLFLLEAESTPLGIELATFRLVAQCLNQLRHNQPHVLFEMVRKGIRLPSLKADCMSVIETALTVHHLRITTPNLAQ
jgi:hypothetical protein